VLGGVVVVVSVGSVVPVGPVVSEVSVTTDPPVPVVSVVGDEAVVSAPAGPDVGATTTVTAPAIESPASSAAATARRRDSLREAGRVGTIETSGETRSNGRPNGPLPLSVTYSP
jgi:hypothetical protein